MNRYLSVAVLGLLLQACGGNDSENKANEANEQRIDAQAVGVSDEAKQDAKKTAGRLVELTSMNLTEYELSQAALRQATNPEVKALAQQAVNRFAQQDKALRDLARDLKIVLPTELSAEGRDRLEDLTAEKAGTAFDLKYLEQIQKVTNEMSDLADDLADDAPNDAVREYGNRAEKEASQRADRAKSLRNVLG
jgi:predicted outer membrane protein